MNIARFLATAFLLIGSTSGQAQSLTQTFLLRPGWNSLWIEVDPPDRSPDVVFAGLPVASVWTWSDRVSATDFIQNPETAGWNRAQWLSWFPATSPEAPLANLYSVLPQRAYLVRLAGTNTMPWSLEGRPVLRTTTPWAADRYNLRGFPVDPDGAPTFQQFFRASPAHFTAAGSRLESIYRLETDGAWRTVQPDEAMRRGEAYWVYTRGPSDFVAPFGLQLSSGDHLEFGGGLDRIDLTLRNALPVAKTVRIQPAGPHASPLLLVPTGIATSTNSSSPLATHDQPLPAASARQLRLGLDRSLLSDSPATHPVTGAHATLLSVSDGEGTKYFVGVTATALSTPDYTGLWSGSILITNVMSPLDTTLGAGPVAASFPLRMLLHVNDAGQVQLLRDVTIVTTRTNAALTFAPATELVTDPSRLLAYSSSDIRAGNIRGRRLTSPHFDFGRSNGQFALPLEGTFGSSNTISGSLSLPGDSPGNPFRHRYHPDHATNAYGVTRAIQLQLTPNTGDGSPIQGTYSETLTGLHKLPLQVSGSLELRRLSSVGVLNSGSTP